MRPLSSNSGENAESMTAKPCPKLSPEVIFEVSPMSCEDSAAGVACIIYFGKLQKEREGDEGGGRDGRCSTSDALHFIVSGPNGEEIASASLAAAT